MRKNAIYLSFTAVAAILLIQTEAREAAAAISYTHFDVVDSVSKANEFFVSQYHSRFNPAGSWSNANCGPASLAMALKRFFVDDNIVQNSEPERLIRIARLAMTGDTDDTNNTDNDDVVKGAAALGIQASTATTISGIDAVLDSGGLAVVSGSPSVPGSFGTRLPYKHCKHGHFIVLAGRDGDRYVMNDPESPSGSFEITRSELRAFMSYWPPQMPSLHGAVTLWPPESPVATRIAQYANLTM